MATLQRIGLSLVSFGPPMLSSLCARHRLLWLSCSRQRCTCLSSASCKGTKDGAAASGRLVTTEGSPENVSDKKDFSAISDPEMSEMDVGEDLIKLKAPSKKTKDMLFEKQPPKARSTLQFTIGREMTTLDRAIAKKDSLSDDLETEASGKLPATRLKLKRSRTNPTSENTLEMLEYLDTYHTLSRKDRDLYSESLPSLLGASVEEVEGVAEELEGAGFSPEVVNRLLPVFPHILEVNYENVYKVFALLKEHLRHMNRVMGLVWTHPFLLTLDPSQIRETLETLGGCGLWGKDLYPLLAHHPLLFFTPLTEGVLTRIREAQGAGLGLQWLGRALLYNLQFRPPRAEFGSNAVMVTKLLSAYHVDVGDVLIKYPDLFSHSHDQLLVLIKTLSAQPLYLNKEDIGKMFSQIPEVLCQLDDMDALRAHLTLLSEIFTAYTLRIKLFSVKLLLDYRYDPVTRLRELAEAGFKQETTSTLLDHSPSVLLQSDLQNKIRLLLDIPGVTHGNIAESARSCLQHSLPSLEARVKFAKHYSCEMLSGDRLEDLFGTSDEQFADLCGGHKVQSFYSQTGFVPLSQYEKHKVKKGRPRNSKGSKSSRKTANNNAQPPKPRTQLTTSGQMSLKSIFSPQQIKANQSTPQQSDILPVTNLVFDDASDNISPEELTKVQLSLDSISFDSAEDSKRDSCEMLDFTDNIVNKEMEEVLQHLRAASLNKDPLFDGSAVSISSRSGESFDEHLFWEYDGFEDEFYEQQTVQQSV